MTTARPIKTDLLALLRLAGPVAVARLGIMAMGLSDVLIVGRHSSTELGYMALSWGLTSVILTAAVGFLSGVQVLTARYMGQGRPELTGGVFRRGVVYSLWIGLISAVALNLFGPALLASFGLAPGLAEGAVPSLRVFAFSLTPYLIATAGMLHLEALGRTGPGVWAMWIANAVNVALDLWLVPGGFGVEAQGAVGAAWGTLAARVILALLVVGYILRMPAARAMGVFERPRDSRAAALEQRRIGYGAGASQFVEAAAFSGMNVVAGLISALAVAGWAIVLNVSAIVFMVSLGISAATGVLVSRYYGARDGRGVLRAGMLGSAVATVYGVIAALVTLLGAGLIASAYATDPQLVALATGGVALAGLFFAVDAIQVVAAQALRSRGDVLAPTITHVFSYALVMLPLGWALAIPAGLGLTGVLWAVIIASFVSAGLLIWRFLRLAAQPL
jgi:multidrug resistance protein, MATE family